MYVKADFKLPELFVSIIEEELNVKAVEFTEDVKGFTSYSFKPQLKTVGPKYGKQLGDIRNALSTLDGNVAMETLETEGALKFNFGGVEVVLTKEDLLISTAQTIGFESVSDYGITVALDTNLTPELIEEGIVRELVSKIQTMRKDSGFEVMDNIILYISGNQKIVSVAKNNMQEIMSDVLAKELKCDTEYSAAKEWDINGEKVTIGVEKV
jgi:isoleucyl-tRNA synthetase